LGQKDVRELVSEAAAASPANVDSRLKWSLFALLVLLATALALKGLDDRLRDSRATLTALQGDMQGVAGRLDGRIKTLEEILRRGANMQALPYVDASETLAAAAASPEGSRLAEAAKRADVLRERGRSAGLTESGDLVFVFAVNGVERLAVVQAGNWLAPAGRGSRLFLADAEIRAGVGDPLLTEASARAPLKSPAMQNLGAMSRAATACAPLASGDLHICRTLAQPMVGLNDIVRLLIFALLMAAPMLAIFGLARRVSNSETIRIVQEVRENEVDRIMALVMRGARAGYWEWTDASGGIFLSDGAADLFGIDGSGIVDMPIVLSVIHSEHRMRIVDMMERARSIGWIQTSFPTLSIPERWIELRGSFTESHDGGAPIFGGIVLDITERRQQEERVRAAERRLRGAIEGFDGPFALWDHKRRLLYWNRAFAIDFQLTDVLRAGMGQDTVVLARAGAVKHEQQSNADRRTTMIALQNGRWIKMVDRETNDGGLITVGVDVTENVRNEEELKKQRERMKKMFLDLERSEGKASELSRKYHEEKQKAEHAASTKSAFLANMSHELRTPLNAINGFSEILTSELYGPLGDGRYKGYAQDILTSGQHLLDMINDILDMAKIEAGKMTISPQPIDPVDPVDAAVRMIRRKAEDKQIALVLDAQPGLPDIEADHRAICQMVLNLVSNAIKFTDAGGRITVRVAQHGPEIYVGVTDTGIGIPPEDLPRLAKPFEQVSGSRDRNHEGTGLGLALTKSFAEMHGGRMSLTSIYGEGTTVSFTLPIGKRNSDTHEIEREVA
jgi:two-component system cell cycle sensor histidine kinase PleC